MVTSQTDRFVSENTLNVGRKGWTENQQSYTETREILLSIPTTFTVTDIRNLKPETGDILIASNIFKGGFATKEDFDCLVLES